MTQPGRAIFPLRNPGINSAPAVSSSLWGRNRPLDQRTDDFERTIWPHAAAAYSFARWIVRNPHDAEDIVQESLVKALRSLHTRCGASPKPWLLAIVRNTALNFLNRERSPMETEWSETADRSPDTAPDPERGLINRQNGEHVRAAIRRLQPEFREALVLRELEGMPYKEIGSVLGIPIGTVMSRLSRARHLLADEILGRAEGGAR